VGNLGQGIPPLFMTRYRNPFEGLMTNPIWTRFLNWFRATLNPTSEFQKPYDRYWALRRAFLQDGVYCSVVVDVLTFGCFPAYDHNRGDEIMIVTEVGDLQHFTVARDGRIWVPLREVPYEDEPRTLARLRERLPDAEYRAVWDGNYPDARRGYYAFRLQHYEQLR